VVGVVAIVVAVGVVVVVMVVVMFVMVVVVVVVVAMWCQCLWWSPLMVQSLSQGPKRVPPPRTGSGSSRRTGTGSTARKRGILTAPTQRSVVGVCCVSGMWMGMWCMY
jgi:hypothetical protein